ncbi:MAG: diacylglycerol kinase family protein [Candidatus Gastranaerophilales bacterium]|nr:diacylglycerol kinase family protein [Candidatus Gastranaerophilales bacterium]
MTKYKSQGFRNTFKNARKGFRLVLKSERNIRIHLIAGSLVIAAAILLQFDVTRFCLVLFAIALVMVPEMINTAIEFTLDSYYHNKYNKMVGMAKDISAGAVMLSSIISITIGCIIFGQAIIEAIARGHLLGF